MKKSEFNEMVKNLKKDPENEEVYLLEVLPHPEGNYEISSVATCKDGSTVLGYVKITTTMKMPENLDQALQLWGKEHVYDWAMKSAVIALQATLRNSVTSGNPEALESLAKEWFPGWKPERSKRETFNAIENMIASGAMTDEERKQLLQKLTAAKK